MYRTFTPLLGVLLTSLLGFSPVHAQFDELVQKVPYTANAIFLVNVEKVLASPPAVAASWKTKRDESYAAGITILPTDTRHAVLAAHFDLDTLVSLWETAIVSLDGEASLPAFAKANGGSQGRIENLPTVALPGDAFAVQFAPQIVGAIAPASRQTTGRWIRQTKASADPTMSPYLMEAYHFANDLGTPVIMAIDLEDALSSEQIATALSEIDLLKTEKIDPAETATFLEGMRGLMLGVTFADKPFGKIKVDFRSEVTLSPAIAKHLLIEALATKGASLVELYDWTPAVKGKTFTLEGNLTAGGLRRVFSLFDRPPAIPLKETEVASANAPPLKKDQAEVQATRMYLTNVQVMLEDLRKEPRENPGYSIGQIGVWYEAYARKIDRLSTMYVDPAAAEFGSAAATNLRNAAQAVRQGSAVARITTTRIPAQYNYYTYNNIYGYAYRWNLYGSGVYPVGDQTVVAVEDVAAQKRLRTAARTQARLTALNEAKGYVDQVYTDLGDVRKKLSEKFQTTF